VETSHVHVNECAAITGHNMGSWIQSHEAVITSQRPVVLAIEPMQQRLYKIDYRLIWRFFAGSIYLFARFLLLASPQIHEDHQHPRLKNVPVNSECFAKRLFGSFVVF